MATFASASVRYTLVQVPGKFIWIAGIFFRLLDLWRGRNGGELVLQITLGDVALVDAVVFGVTSAR